MQALMQKLDPYWLVFMVLESAIDIPTGEMESSVSPSCVPCKL